ncbi:hypothetical protein [Luteolibacter sp. LG18]|uniref:hypothetical protein n=1 Tax=Luteolibacter sp. LG18 TaxID=2819286 RepID=UPI0030C732FA
MLGIHAGIALLAMGVATASPPSASAVPAITTATTAVLKAGAVSPGAAGARVWFEYGATTTYGNSTLVYPFTAFIQTLQIPVAGLSPETTFHYRVRATNNEDSYTGPDSTFTTAALPTVSTTAATSITDLGATLNATVNPAGVSSTLSFEYGPTVAYGSTTGSLSVTGSTSMAKSLNAALSAGSTFHYRAKLTNVDGTWFGADITVTTLAATTAPTITGSPSSSGLAATGVKVTQGGLAAGSSAATLVVEYGPTTAYGSQVVYPTPLAAGSTGKSLALNLAGLTPGTLYHYRARLTNQEGIATGTDASFTTTQLPIVTTGEAVTASPTTASLQGSANPGGGTVSAAFQYWAYTAESLSTATPVTSSLSGSSPVSTTVNLTGLSPGTRYFYRLSGKDQAGVTYTGEILEFTTPALSLPGVITGQATSILADSAAVPASAVQPGAPPATVTIEYGTTFSYDSVTEGKAVETAAGSGPSFKLLNLVPETTYHYRATIVDVTGISHGEDMQFTTAAVSLTSTTGATQAIAPTAATLNGSFKLNAATSTASFEYGTDLSYGQSVAASSPTLAAASGTYSVRADLVNLMPGTLYHYRSVQVNPYGTVYGTDQTFTTLASDQPVAITDSSFGTASLGSPTGSLLMRGSVRTFGLPANVFFQCTSQGVTTIVAATPATVPAGTETVITANLAGLSTSAGCSFKVIATNAAGTSYGATLIGSPFQGTSAQSISVTLLTGNLASISVSTTGQTSTSASYLEYGLTSAYGTKVTSSFAIFTLGFPTPLQPETTYHYRVVLADGFGTAWYSDDMTFTTDYRTPAVGSFLASAITDTSAQLAPTITPYTDETLSLTVTEVGNPLNVFIPIVTPGTAPAFATTISTAFLTGLKPGTTYSYKVKGAHLNPMGFTSSNTLTKAAWRFTTLTRSENWRRIHFGTTSNEGDAADTATPRNDGIPNLLKYALGIDPAATIATLPPAETAVYGGDSYLRYRFPRDPASTDIVYLVEAADSPAGPWSVIAQSAYGAATTGPGFVSETPSGNTRIVETRDTMGISASPHRFMRLRVTR